MRRLLVRMGLLFEDPRDEASFLERYVLRHRLAIQLLGLAAAALNYSYTFLDRMLDPTFAPVSNAFRGGISLFIVALVAGLAFVPALRRRLEVGMAVAMAVIAAGLTMAMLGMRVAEQDYGLWGLAFVLMIVVQSNLFPMRLGYLVAGNLCVLVAAGFVAVRVPPGPSTFVNEVTVVAAAAIGIIAVARRELVARREWRLTREVEEARARIESLLHTMLPADVARRIEAGATAVADDHPEVTIVFADMVGFTALSRRISAAELVELLNGVFSAIDRLAERHGVERIKTVGDCYMAVAGFTPGGGDPARAAADFALAVPAVVAEATRAAGHPLEARVGLHVGPVVAGVIGVQRPAFDCWGASVNLASRLETAATPGAVLISEEAWRRLGAGYSVAPLPAQDLKGFGPTPVYRLDGLAG